MAQPRPVLIVMGMQKGSHCGQYTRLKKRIRQGKKPQPVKAPAFCLVSAIRFMDMVKIPRKVVLIITFRCQLRCRICNVDSVCLGREELTTSEIIGILNNLSKDGVSAVDFVGGEIFVRNDIR